jgi:lactoylglutathione lyase
MPTAIAMPNLFSRDMQAALGFYRDQLGFSPSFQVPREGPPEHAVLALGESRIALSTDRAVSRIGLEPSGGNSFELIVFCDDVDGETARLRAAGASVMVAPYDHVAGHRRSYVADPDGNWVALVDAAR